MKRLFFLFFCIVIIILGWMIFTKQEGKTNAPASLVHPFSVIMLAGDTLDFTPENFPGKLVFNFYSTDCSICMMEISDIVSYSNKYKTPILFVTADSIEQQQGFASQLQHQGLVNNELISFARISLEDANQLFAGLTVPQTIVFSEGLKIMKIKKGPVSVSFLRKSLE